MRLMPTVCFHADVVAVFSLKQNDSHPVMRDSVRSPYLCYTKCCFCVFFLFALWGFPLSIEGLSADDSFFKVAGCHRAKVFFWKCAGLLQDSYSMRDILHLNRTDNLLNFYLMVWRMSEYQYVWDEPLPSPASNLKCQLFLCKLCCLFKKTTTTKTCVWCDVDELSCI